MHTDRGSSRNGTGLTIVGRAKQLPKLVSTEKAPYSSHNSPYRVPRFTYARTQVKNDLETYTFTRRKNVTAAHMVMFCFSSLVLTHMMVAVRADIYR